MFTGLIELVGTARELRRGSGPAKLTVDVGSMARDLVLGESVAVNGACLTVVSASGSEATFDVVPETLSRTSLSKLSSGDRVNIERALRADARLGGHFVQGHVDGVGRIARVNQINGAVEIEIVAPQEVMELVVPKGSIAVDGISLTVARRNADGFAIAIIPHTLENTTLGAARPGAEVNLETDILGKYVLSLLRKQDEGGVSERLLRDAGFM